MSLLEVWSFRLLQRFAQCFGQTDFKTSTSWLIIYFLLKVLHMSPFLAPLSPSPVTPPTPIGNRKIWVEQVLSSVSETVEPFQQKLSILIKEEKLCLAQLYSGGETDLFWKSMPKNSQTSRKDVCLPGRKIHTERLSALLCANADGTHKLKSHYWKIKAAQKCERGQKYITCSI